MDIFLKQNESLPANNYLVCAPTQDLYLVKENALYKLKGTYAVPSTTLVARIKLFVFAFFATLFTLGIAAYRSLEVRTSWTGRELIHIYEEAEPPSFCTQPLQDANKQLRQEVEAQQSLQTTAANALKRNLETIQTLKQQLTQLAGTVTCQINKRDDRSVAKLLKNLIQKYEYGQKVTLGLKNSPSFQSLNVHIGYNRHTYSFVLGMTALLSKDIQKPDPAVLKYQITNTITHTTQILTQQLASEGLSFSLSDTNAFGVLERAENPSTLLIQEGTNTTSAAFLLENEVPYTISCCTGQPFSFEPFTVEINHLYLPEKA